MTLLLRPVGRGNWRPLTIAITGQRAAPLLVRRGHRFELGGIVFRVVEVRA